MRQLKIGQNVAIGDTASLSRYLKELKKCRLLTHEEEIILSQKSRAGDLMAQSRLISANLLFVVSVAKRYQNSGMSLGDLINEGNVGLIKASTEFDSTRGFRFISYAIWPIRQSILYAITDQRRSIRLPQNAIGVLSRINKSVAQLQQELERNPTVTEIAEHIQVPEKKVIDYIENDRPALSLHAVNEENGYCLLDTLGNQEPPTDEAFGLESLQQQVKVVMKSLSRKERNVLSLIFGLNGVEPVKMEDIASQYELSKERIRQIKDKALKKLKERNPVLFLRIKDL